MRLFSRNSGVALLASCLLAGCAAKPPDLPPDTTGLNRTQQIDLDSFAAADRALACPEITTERSAIAAKMQNADERIQGNRSRNEAAVLGLAFISPLLIPLAEPTGLAAGNDAEKAEIQRLYARRDLLIKLAGVKSCPAP